MKRTVIVAAGVMALSLGIVVSHRLWAQNTTARATPPTPTTKVALLNLSYVMRHYERFKTFNEEIKAAVKPFQDRDTDCKKQLEALGKEAQDPKTTVDRREQIERKAKELQRAIEDNKVEAQKTIGKRHGEQLKILYMDVHNVVSRFAQAHGYDMVLHFQDALTTPEYWSPANIDRKLRVDALLPMYYNPALDISGHVVAALNASLKTPAAPAANRR